MSARKFDVCVIGAGPGGYVAAIQAARNGAKTVIVERANFGGTCLNVGCIPTKTLIAGAEALKVVKEAEAFGVKISGKPEADWSAMMKRKDGVIEKLRGGIDMLLKNAGVEVIKGSATLAGRGEVVVTSGKGETEKISAGKLIIATGSKPAMPKFIPKADNIVDSTGLLAIGKIPERLLVLGGGYIGCEFACLFAALGSKVTVVEMLPDILMMMDGEVRKLLAKEMKKNGIEVLTGTPLEKISSDGKTVKGSVGSSEVAADVMLVSIGRVPETAGLGLEAAGIKTNEKGFIPVDDKCRTNAAGVYAIGDVTGRIMLAHLASAMGTVAAANACGKRDKFSDLLVPGCVFTMPEIGSVGLTEEQCKEKGVEVNVGKFPFASLGKAMAINETVGFCKVIASKDTDQVLGVHIIGPHATDLIAEAVPALEMEVTAEELGKAIHAHPTLGEAMMEAAHAVHGRSAHIPVKKSR